MAYVDPTAAEIKTRFPEFAAVDDALISLAIAETASFVDTSWIEADYKPAKMHLAAHLLFIGGALNADVEGGAVPNSTTGEVQSVKVGDVSVNFASGTSSSSVGGTLGSDLLALGSTTYGLWFLALRKRNFPAVAVVT